MEWTRLALDYIDTLIWPFVVAGLFVFFTYRFRKNLAGLIDRVQGMKGPGGIEVTTGPSDQSPSSPMPGAEADAMSEVVKNIAVRYSEIATNLAQRENDVKAWAEAYDSIDALYKFERIYRMIHGSQLSLMQYLARQPDRKASKGVLQSFFDQHVRAASISPGYTPNREAFFGFLSNSQMIEEDGEAQTYGLTGWGEVFLNYMSTEQMPVVKSY